MKTFAELRLRPHADNCLRCGLSVFDSEAGAVRLFQYMQRRHPNVEAVGPFVFRLQLTPNDGRVKQTNRPPHHTWWMYSDVDRLATFREMVKDARHALPD